MIGATIKGQLPFQLTTHNSNFDVVMKIFDANPEGINAIDVNGMLIIVLFLYCLKENVIKMMNT